MKFHLLETNSPLGKAQNQPILVNRNSSIYFVTSFITILFSGGGGGGGYNRDRNGPPRGGSGGPNQFQRRDQGPMRGGNDRGNDRNRPY